VEAMIQSYSGRRLQAIACDFWDGTEAQCDLFQNVAGIDFPVLQQCSGLGAPNMFACTYHYVFVIDHEGIVRYRGTNLTAANLIIGQALDVLEAGLVGVDDAPPPAVTLEAAYPNPFNPSVRIPFRLAADAPAVLDIVDVRGRVVRVLANGSYAAGRHEVVWDGTNAAGQRMPSGAYLARLRSGGVTQARLVSLVK
jgi:hypothetical protein